MTDEMLQLARASAARVGVENVEFRKGYLEDMPLADETVDVVISNCVINLTADKPQVLREAARVLRPGDRFAISDVIADPIEAQPASASVEGSSDALTARFHATRHSRRRAVAASSCCCFRRGNERVVRPKTRQPLWTSSECVD